MTNRPGGGGVSSKPLKGRLGGGGVDTITRTVKVQYRYELSDMDVHCEGRFGALCSKERVLIVNLDSPESVTGTLSCRGPHGAALVRWNHSRPGPHFVAATVHQNVVVWDVSRFGHVGSTGDPATAAAAAPPPTGQSIIAHARAVSELCWSPHEEALFATVSADMFLNLWDLRDGRKGVQNLKHLKNFGGALRGVRWNPLNAKTLAVVHDSGDVRIWDLRMDSSVPTAHFLVPGKASSLDWSPKREHEFLTSSQDTPAVHFWSTQSASSKPHRTLVPPTPLHKAVYTSFGDGVVTASRSREAEAQALQLWRLSDLALLHSFSGHTGRVRAFAFRHRGSFVHQLVSLGEDKTLRMWPIDTALQQGCAQPPRDAADSSSSPSDLPSRVVHSSDRHLDLEQEFVILRTLAPRILGCRVAETSTLRRTCVLVVQLTPGAVPGCGRDTVVHLKVILPLHYPNGAAPSFELMADSKISPRVRVALRDALNATAQELVAKSTPCLIQCVAVMVPELLSLHSQKQQQHRVAVILSGEMGHHTTTEDESASDDLLSSSLHDMASGGNQSAEALATPFPRLRRVSWVGNDRLLVLNPSGHLRGISFRHSKGEALRCRTYAEFQQLLLARISDFSSRAHEPVDLPPLHTAQGVGSSSLLPGRSSSMLAVSGLDPSASGRPPLPGKFATFSKFPSPGKASGAQSEAPAAALRTSESYTSLSSLSLAADNDISRLFEDEEDHRMDDASDMIDFSAIPQPFASHGVIFDASELLLLNATLAAGYAVLFSPHYPAHAASAGPHGASVSQICSHNAQLAASAHRQDLVQTWGILSGVTAEIERLLTISGEGGGGGSRGNWHAHPFGRLLVTQILEHYMRLRDLQTVAMIVAVLVVNSALYSDRSSRSHGHHPFKKTKYAFGLLGKAGIQRYDAVRHLYAEALRRYGLDHLAAQVTKFTKATEPPMSTPKIAFCSACNVRIGGIRKFCRSCQYAAPSCALCDLPVRGLSLCCPLCGHGGHVDHLRSWFASRSSCPTACGCNCSLA